MEAIEKAGYTGKIKIGMDVAASEFYKDGQYQLHAEGRSLDAGGITDMLAGGGMQMRDVADMVEKGQFKREYRDHRLEWMIKVGGVEVVTKGLERDNIRFGPDLH